MASIRHCLPPGSNAAAGVLSILGFIAVGIAQFGLVARPAVEVTVHRYSDTGSALGLLMDSSRQLLVLALLLPMLAETPCSLGISLRAAVAALPLLWALGIVPQLDELSSWAFDQLEVHIFGGSPAPDPARLLCGFLFSSASAVAMAQLVSHFQEQVGEDDLLPAVVAVSFGLPLAAILAPMPPQMKDFGRQLLTCLCAALAQAVVAVSFSLGLVMAFGSDVASAAQASLETDVWCAKIAFEQGAAMLAAVCLYGVAARNLRADVGATGFCDNRTQYRSARNRLLWGEKGVRSGPIQRSPGLSPASDILCDSEKMIEEPKSEGAEASRLIALKVASVYQVLEAMVRLLLLVHMSVFGGAEIIRSSTVELVFESALLLRAWRIAFADPTRAAVDAWLVGLLDILLHSQAPSFFNMPLPARMMLVSVFRQRLWAFLALAQYAAHLSWVTLAVPKLRHAFTEKVLLTNVVFFPGLILVLICTAALESPLLALFTLPVFAVGYPRRRHGHLELATGKEPMMKGLEGIFYASLMPSLLRGLAVRWRCCALSAKPGTTLFCRSHERLACVIRVLSSGFGWVQIEVRGLEMQEPTSCHHIEAGKIDDTFKDAFCDSTAPRAFQSNPGTQDAFGGAGSDDRGAGLPLRLEAFALRPVCEVTALGYEQTQISLRGLIDNPETLKQVHQIFLRTLVWMFSQAIHQQRGSIPKPWLSCAIKPRDAQAVMSLLRSLSWPQDVSASLGCGPKRHQEEERDSLLPSSKEAAMGSGRGVVHGPQDVGGSDLGAEAAYRRPEPPPGTPPDGVRLRAANGSPEAKLEASAFVLPEDKTPGLSLESQVADLTTDAGETEPDEDLDALMDAVLGMAPSSRTSARPSSALSIRSAASTQVPLASLPGGINPASGPYAGAPLKPPRQLAPLELEEKPHRHKRPGSAHRSKASKAAKEKAESAEELTEIARLVVQAYIAINIAPSFGQPPESLGSGHVERIFSGDVGQASQAREVQWLQGQSEFQHLTLKAFRYAVKVAIDLVAMGEDASNLEYEELDAALQEIDRNWFLGREGTSAWEAAMKQRVPNLSALRKKGLSEVQVVRLSLVEDGVRVGELRPEVVQSIWASASVELRYLANDDDERYSIQAHPTLLRNMVLQSAEYPIYVSPPTTVWL